MNLLLIDASAYIHRAYHALPLLSRRDGTPTGAVAGFASMLWKAISYGVHEQLPGLPSHVGIIFDAPGRNFRHSLYPAYKATRGPRSAELTSQFDVVRHACRAFGLKAVEQRGYEADDVIGTYATEATGRGFQTVIASADKDLMQLVSPWVVLVASKRDPETGAWREVVINSDAVREKFGVAPERMVDYLALVGDPGDNVPGVPSVGAKTAAVFLREFGTLDLLLAHAARGTSTRVMDIIHRHADQARLSRDLVRLNTLVPLDVPLADLAWSGAIETGPILEFCDEMEFVSLRQRIERALERAA